MAPKTSKKGSKKAGANCKRPEHHKKRHASFISYIAKAAKAHNGDLRISKQGMLAMEGMLKHVMWKLIKESEILVHSAKRTSLKAEDFIAAVSMILPGPLGASAHNAGLAAHEKYVKSE